jgi:DNA-binding NtrC family response regulator
MEESRKRVLVVDDEAGIRDSLKLLLRNHFEVSTASDGGEALLMVDDIRPDLILLDVIMPTLGGIETLRRIREKAIPVPVIMLTATNTVRTAVEAMKLGAVDYLNKPFDVEELTTLIVKTLGNAVVPGMEAPKVSRTQREAPAADFGLLVGQSTPMRQLFESIKQIAPRDATVLITGESGTGKEMIARQIHELSARASGPFVAINCAAIPESLIESELFGHEKGAFTHAVERRIGHFELADGGTLFLDEIGELSLAVQVKMLRFLQEQEFYRVGRSKPIQVNVRVIAATNKNLEELIRQKIFREDLYYRIHVVNLHLPPLRDRFDDIANLAQYFIRKLGPSYGERQLAITAEAMDKLVEYPWPGNVRELENVIESLLALSPADEVKATDLPPKLLATRPPESFRPQLVEGGMKFEEAERVFEREMILKALRKTNFIQTRAAELLGISRRILKYKMDKLGISETVPSEPSVAELATNTGTSEATLTVEES